MEEEAASYYGVGRKGGYRTKKGGNNEESFTAFVVLSILVRMREKMTNRRLQR